MPFSKAGYGGDNSQDLQHEFFFSTSVATIKFQQAVSFHSLFIEEKHWRS